MKKLTCMGLSLALMAGLLAGCGSNGTTSTPTSTPAASSTPVQSQTTTLSGTVNTDGSTLCAERTALVKAVSEGRTGGFTAIAIAGRGSDFCWPCGACRQMLFEFAPQLRVLAVRGDGAFQSAPLSTLLPCGFGPGSLNF